MFAARRRPKRVVSSDTREDDSNQQDEESGPLVRRPVAAPKTKSKLRISFDPGPESTVDGQPTTTDATSKPPRVGPSSLSRNRTPATVVRDNDHVERPTYSKSYLEELKGSTPSTPKDLSTYASSTEDELPLATQAQALDIAAKFGTSSVIKPSLIPSAAEIQEKKDRRLRLAREQQGDALASAKGGSINNNDDYVSLDAYDSDGEFKPSRLQVSTHLHNDRLENAHEYTRLIPEDEDVAEGFETFVDDDHEKNVRTGRIPMGMKTSDAVDRQKMRELINNAEGGSDTNSDDDASDASSASDASAEHAYMAAQTSHGVAFSHLTKDQRRRHERESRRPRQPEKTTPVPTLAAGLARLRELQRSAEMNKQRAETRQAEIRTRLAEVDGEKRRIQNALEELGKQLEESHRTVTAQNGDGNGQNVQVRQSGLDDIAGRAP